jgi:glycosyltransferase involved in cell wall biosynthesis
MLLVLLIVSVLIIVLLTAKLNVHPFVALLTASIFFGSTSGMPLPLLITSIEEGFAMVQFQAMACGLPLICTTNTGGEDLITNDGEEGFVIPIRDVDAIKEKILYLFNNPNIAKKMGQSAKIKVRDNFSWDDYGNRYVENLRKITSNNEY